MDPTRKGEARLAPPWQTDLRVQAITIDVRKFASYRRQPDFIQTDIFPGGMLPTDDLVRLRARQAGLDVHEASGFAPSYARTLAAWRERFEQQWEVIKESGFDPSFRRLWNYYLVYCETGFESGALDVKHYRLGKRL